MSPPWICTACRSFLATQPDGLCCPTCATIVPLVDGIACFSGVPAAGTGDEAAYQRFLLARSRYPVRDAYAAFQPFNEAGRTWQVFRERLAALLRPGDIILDLANRSGWTGAELAAAFPAQMVISCWEGDSDVLGHRGYRYWYGGDRRPANLHLAFIAAAPPLPLADGVVRVVHGHDLLHHCGPEIFPEVLRVLDDEGCALFPHVHTADAEPDPWFRREGTLRHAAEYRARLAELVGPGRCGLVLGEATLFTGMVAGRPSLAESAAMVDYNAIVAIVPERWVDGGLGVASGLPADHAASVVLLNPLLTIDPADGRITLAPDAESLPGHLLPRHPVYARHLRARLPERLGHAARLLCYWAERLPTVGDIALRLGMDRERMQVLLAELQHADVVWVGALDPSTARLQRCHASGADLPTVEADHPQALWRRAVDCFPDRPCLVFGEGEACLSYAQADGVVRAIARRMARAGIDAGSAVLVADGLGVESLLFIWAATLRSATVVVCDPEGGPPALHGLSIAAVFARTAGWAVAGAALLGPDGSVPPGWTALPSWYEDGDLTGDDPVSTPIAGQAGVVLFTSGSTGTPKGVQLSWSAVARSARQIARHYRWSEEDRLLSLGGLHTMSGLRNPCFATVAAGAAVIVPEEGAAATALTIAGTICARGVSVLGAAPATLQGLLAVGERIADLVPLRLVLCTGSRLPPDLRRRFSERFTALVCNYYGLTETCGFCFGDDPDGVGGEDIGRPVDALIRVVDAQGDDVPRGEAGELLIHSANLMLGYVGQDRRRTDDHWYRTGDLARITCEGRCVLVGRLREILKNPHGEIVSCREVEDALLSLPGVADAAVLPSADGDGLERSVAWVVAATPPDDPEAWLAALREALFLRLGAKRMPSRILLRADLPRSSNGKLRRELLDIAENRT